MLRKRVLLKWFIILTLTHISMVSNAETPFSPVSLATGRARVATNELGTQVLANPATLVHAPAMAAGLFVQLGLEGESQRNQHNTMTIVDNGDDVFAAGGLLYSESRRSFLTAADYEEQRLQMSFGGFIYEQLSMGVNINHFRIDIENDSNNFLETSYTLWDWDIGFLWNPNPDFAVGAVIESLAHHSGSIPTHIRPRDRATIGVNYIAMEQFRVRADITRFTDLGGDNSDGDWDLRAGFESYVDAWLAVRAGYETQNSTDTDYISAGFGFRGPRLLIDYAYRKNTDFSDGALHGVDFRLPF